ncbi:hypothetical protein ACWGTI_22995 [Mesorhizobium sp. ArgA1]
MASFTPQAWKIIRTLDPKSILAPMNALTVFGFALWLTFGLMKDESPIFILQRTVLPKAKKEAVAGAVDPPRRSGDTTS